LLHDDIFRKIREFLLVASNRQFDLRKEKALMIFGRKRSSEFCLFSWTQKESVLFVVFFSPKSFLYNSAARVKESKTGHLKTPKNGQKRSIRRQSCTDSRSSDFLDRVRTCERAKRSIRISAFSSRKFISSSPGGKGGSNCITKKR